MRQPQMRHIVSIVSIHSGCARVVFRCFACWIAQHICKQPWIHRLPAICIISKLQFGDCNAGRQKPMLCSSTVPVTPLQRGLDR